MADALVIARLGCLLGPRRWELELAMSVPPSVDGWFFLAAALCRVLAFAIVEYVLLLITGASGVGKSTIRTAVAPELSPEVECVELKDLGLLRTPRTRGWRQQLADAAVRRAVELHAEGRHLLLAGDPVPAVEVVAAPSASQLDALAVCLLDASAEAQAERLAGRGDDPALLVHHQAFADWMRHQANDPRHMLHVVSDSGWEEMRWDRLDELGERWRMHTIDTSHQSRQAVSGMVIEWCRAALAGEAPVLQIAGAATKEVKNL